MDLARITVHSLQTAEVAFTGDTSIGFVHLPDNHDVFHAKLLIMECTFFDDVVGPAGAKERGHMHIKDIAEHAHCFKVRDPAVLHPAVGLV